MKYKHICLSIFIMCALNMHALVDLYQVNRDNGGKMLITPYYVQKLYQLIKDVHEVFEFYGIEYWIQGGTLLGALRHGGLMWWDDDIDINVKLSDVPKILELAPVFKLLGYDVKEYIYKTFRAVKIGNLSQFVVDVCPTIHQDGKTTYALHWWKREGKPIYLDDHELYPLVKYPFGELELWGPYDPFVYLSCGFGSDYMNKINIFNHRTKARYQCDFKDVAPEFQTHVKPNKLLENKVAALNLKKE